MWNSSPIAAPRFPQRSDFRHTLSAGGGRLTVGSETAPREGGVLGSEYEAIYNRFADLVAKGESEVDARPLQLVADILLTAKHVAVEPFED